MRIAHRATGLDAMRRRLASLSAAARTAALPAIDAVARGAAEDIRATIANGSAQGRSRPGAPPDDAAGRIAATLATAPLPDGRGSAVEVASPIARFLEYGTARMAARPFLRPAARRAARGGAALIAAALRREIKP